MRRFVCFLFFLLACSSDPEPSGGSGGSGRTCTPGSTQECVGPAACKGAQVCAFDGSGWGPCDCGGGQGGSQNTSGSGGSGGSGGSFPGQGGSAGSGAGTQAGTGGSSGTGGGSGAGGSDIVPEDKECPTLGAGCQDCCETNHPGDQITKDFATDLVACACLEGAPCFDSCTDICGGANSGVVCNTCLNEKFKSGACGFDSCASSSCKAFGTCVLACP